MREVTLGVKEASGGFEAYGSDHPAWLCTAQSCSTLWTLGDPGAPAPRPQLEGPSRPAAKALSSHPHRLDGPSPQIQS